MKRLSFLAGVWVTILSFCFSVLAPAFVVAATSSSGSSNTGQALEIAPPVITLSVNPGQTAKTQILLRDVSPSAVIVTGEVNDFVAAGEDGTPKILLDNSDTTNPYSVRGWISPPTQLQLAPKEVKSMPITINVPANASPGGHYGIIRFTATAPSLHGTGVSLTASLGALLLITVSGKVKENLSVVQFFASHKAGASPSSLFEATPINFTLRLKNSGNVHEQPVGQATIKDMFGKTVAAVNFNLPPRNILPQSIRKFDAPLDSTVIGNKHLFGHYTANLKVTYGASKQVATSKIGFWVIPYRLIIIVIVILVAGFFGLRFLIKRYNRTIVNRAQSGKKK